MTPFRMRNNTKGIAGFSGIIYVINITNETSISFVRNIFEYI